MKSFFSAIVLQAFRAATSPIRRELTKQIRKASKDVITTITNSLRSKP